MHVTTRIAHRSKVCKVQWSSAEGPRAHAHLSRFRARHVICGHRRPGGSPEFNAKIPRTGQAGTAPARTHRTGQDASSHLRRGARFPWFAHCCLLPFCLAHSPSSACFNPDGRPSLVKYQSAPASLPASMIIDNSLPPKSVAVVNRQLSKELCRLALGHDNLKGHLDKDPSRTIIAVQRHDSATWTNGSEDRYLWIKGNRVSHALVLTTFTRQV